MLESLRFYSNFLFFEIISTSVLLRNIYDGEVINRGREVN